MFLFDCWPVVRPMLRTVRGCYRGGIITFLEAPRFRSSTFWKNDVSSARSFPRKLVSAEYYFEDIGSRTELSTMGSKHDVIKARWENPKLGKNPNFGIMKFFEEAEGTENIFHQRQKYIGVYEKYSGHQSGSGNIFGIDRGLKFTGMTEIRRIVREAQAGLVSTVKQAECLQKLEVSPCMEAVHAA
ncbi:hypothetical protein F2Q68_00005243 [Brassica cretica]|uniref:Uncharacterized protein n=1 Tax=Brassica cretica TaxID=69181 RepID=A0A8S9J743_BRACR|nr:hypothetical protein F2Q68_00005243 [Brassica cretica]